MGGGVQQTPLDNQTEIALKILVFCAEALCLFLKFIQKYFSNIFFPIWPQVYEIVSSKGYQGLFFWHLRSVTFLRKDQLFR